MVETRRDDGVHSVGLSRQEAARAITRRLLQRGRRRIAYAAGQLDPRVMQRRDGSEHALRVAGRYDPTLEWLDPSPKRRTAGLEDRGERRHLAGSARSQPRQ